MFFKVWDQSRLVNIAFQLRPRRIAAVGVATRVADERGQRQAHGSHQSEKLTLLNHVNIKLDKQLMVPAYPGQFPGHLLQRKSAR